MKLGFAAVPELTIPPLAFLSPPPLPSPGSSASKQRGGAAIPQRTVPPARQQQQRGAAAGLPAAPGRPPYGGRRHAQEVPVPPVPLLDQHHDQPAAPRARPLGRAALQVLRLRQGLHPEDTDDQAQLHGPHAGRRAPGAPFVVSLFRVSADPPAAALAAGHAVVVGGGEVRVQLLQVRRGVSPRDASLAARAARAHDAVMWAAARVGKHWMEHRKKRDKRI